MLNMTRISVSLEKPAAATLELELDLGQSLLTPFEYWEIVQKHPKEQLEKLGPIVRYLQQNIFVSTGGIAQALELESATIAAKSLQAIKNPLTPQMATFQFLLTPWDQQQATAPKATIQVSIGSQVDVPWPLLVRVDTPTRALPVSRLLTPSDRSTREIELWAATSDSSVMDQLGDSAVSLLPRLTWVAVGFQHIIPLGLDHILFVLGLFFLAAGARPLIWQVTGFTVAHSLTLALASVGLISVAPAIVEPLIALSIVYIAVDNLYSNSVSKFRFVMVCIFGLLHGLGFASVLQDLSLPTEQFFSSLIAFNLGVEAGQLTVLAIAFAVVGWLRHKQWYIQSVAQPATLSIAGVGLYWLLQRTLV